jgi:hypothetical protein
MPKAVELTPDVMNAPQITPKGAMNTRPVAVKPAKPKKGRGEPLQLRWPREEIRAAKVAAAGNDQTISEYLLACMHASMPAKRQA